jgi:hypothetical protein
MSASTREGNLVIKDATDDQIYEVDGVLSSKIYVLQASNSFLSISKKKNLTAFSVSDKGATKEIRGHD